MKPDHKKSSKTLDTFIYSPLKLVFRHWGVLIVSAGVIALDRYFNFSHEMAASGDFGNWLFKALPLYARKVIHSTPIISLLLISFFLKGIFITYFAYDLSLQFKNARVSAIDSLITLPVWSIIRFLFLQLCIYILFGALAVTIYLLAKGLWTRGLRIAVALVIGSFLLLYPLFYAALSIASLFSILPARFNRVLLKSLRFLRRNNFAKTYFFYLLRSIVDHTCLFVIPALILMVTTNWLVTLLLMSISLSLPIAFVRTSSFAFKLQVLSDDNDVIKEFNEYFHSLVAGSDLPAKLKPTS